MKLLIIAGLADFLPRDRSFDVIMTVDRGTVWALQNGLSIDLAVGDFDSVNETEWKEIITSGVKIEQLKSEKDETDLEVALLRAIETYPEAEITLIGSLGGRLDHELTNIYLPITARFVDFSEHVQQENQQNLITYLKPGRHKLKRLPDKKYIGFVKQGAENFSIENAKYPLKAENNFAEIYTSNEFIDDTMTVSFDSGAVIVIHSSDKP